ncbi:MAG TPA: PAS domain-containing sensor histidine kinase [Kofleriaceae bacterium]|jgi:PAS domain S-box-containing protein
MRELVPLERHSGDIGRATPALLDALSRANIGYVVLLYRNGEFEKLDTNEAAMRNLGYTRDEWLAAPSYSLIVPEQREVVARLYQRLCAGETLARSIELTFIGKNGAPFPMEVSYGHAQIGDGYALVLIWADRATVMPIQQLSTLEADRAALVGALAAGFAHETNNPLTSVLLNLRSLRKLIVNSLADAKQAAALRVLDDVTTGAERIASNVRAFQTLASRGAGGPVDLVGVTSAVLRLAMPTLEPRAHVVRQIFPVQHVTGDESRIGQAVLAMLLFAVSGFPRPGDPSNRIVVAVAERDGLVVVEVSDNGSSLEPDELPHAFDPFFRSAGRGAGVGGGLAIARSVAVTLGGDVRIAVMPAGGAVVTMRLPPAPAPAG